MDLFGTKAGKEISREDLAKAVQGKLKKPKWAMTQEAVEELDEEEAVELLDFADNLNFDESFSFLHAGFFVFLSSITFLTH